MQCRYSWVQSVPCLSGICWWVECCVASLPLGWPLVHSQEKELKWPLLPPQPLSSRGGMSPRMSCSSPGCANPRGLETVPEGTESAISTRGGCTGISHGKGCRFPWAAEQHPAPSLGCKSLISTPQTTQTSLPLSEGRDRGHAAPTRLGK